MSHTFEIKEEQRLNEFLKIPTTIYILILDGFEIGEFKNDYWPNYLIDAIKNEGKVREKEREMLQQARTILKEQGIDFSKDIIEFPASACNQVIMRRGHPMQGYSIRDLLTIWQHETGQKFRETSDES